MNQAGLRFYDETKGQYPTANNYGAIKPYIPGSYLNAANIKWDPQNFLNAALAGTGEATNGGGPIWAIFDADAAKRETWNTTPPDVDISAGFFFSGNTIEELARNIVNKYQRKPIPPAVLQDTVTKYNSYVDAGKDPDFGKPAPKYKIQTHRFTRAGPRRSFTTRARACGSTPSARWWISMATSSPACIAAANPRADSASTALRAARFRDASPAAKPPNQRPIQRRRVKLLVVPVSRR